MLTTELGKLDGASELGFALRAMRGACRKFVDRVGDKGGEVTLYAHHRGHWCSWTFYSALGEMRGVFGIHLARIAAQFELDVEDSLAAILPFADEDARNDSSD